MVARSFSDVYSLILLSSSFVTRRTFQQTKEEVKVVEVVQRI